MKIVKLIFAIVLFTFIAKGQESYEISSGKITINGTSSLHDWDMTAGDFNIKANISRPAEGVLIVEDLELKVKVVSLKSTKGKTMDGKAHNALKKKDHPYIFYNLSEVQSVVDKGDHFMLKTTGDLTIAGVKKAIYMDVKASLLTNGSIRFEGSKALKMTTFGMDPPTALLGTLKTGDDITIVFNITILKSDL